jgi:hypothetical protein
MNKFTSGFAGLVAALGIAAWSVPAFADPIASTDEDPLYAFCYGSTSCVNGGVTTQTVPSSSLQFGFYIAPGPNTGDFFIDILIPTNEDATPSALSFAITGTQGGAANNASISATASLVYPQAWKGGGLTTYLGLTLAPTAPTDGFKNWLAATQAYDPGATGYYVYQADLGINELQAAKKDLLGPLLSLDQLLPEGALIAGYLETPNGAITTDRSAALLTEESPVLTNSPQPVPEPGSLAIFGVALLPLAAVYRSKRA